MKREEVVQKNWRARKKHGSWLFVSSLLVFTLLAPTTAKLTGSLRHVSYGAEREIDPSVNLGNAEYNPKAKLIVTPDNQDTFFTTSADAHKDGNVVTLTDDAPSRKGAYTLFNKISLSESFELVGKINIGKRYEGYSPDGVAGGDGVSFVFTTSEPGVVGLDGASIGLGGIPNSFGFKLDTYHNTSTPNGAAKSDADPKFPGYQNGAFGAFYRTDGGGRAKYAISDAKRLTTQPTNNEFKKVIVSYNGSTKKMTVTYDGQVFERSIQDWINYSRSTTRQVPGQEELAFALFASTGGARNLQQFKLERFEYSAGGSYVTVKYVDADTKQEIKSHKTFRSDGSTPSVNLSSYVNLDGYKLVATNVSTARGYQSGDTVNYVVGSQTVTYAYRVDKDALKAEIAKENTVKNSDKYKNATDAKKKAYDDALAAAKRIDAKSNATVEEVKKAKEDLANAAAALDGQTTNKDALKAEIAKENDVKASAKYKNGSADKKQAYDDALAEAKRIDAKTDATQAEVNKAKQDLADAAAALDGIEVNKDALKAEIAKDPTVKGTDKYKNATDAKKQAYDDALAEAKRIDAKEDATQAEVNKAKQDLANAAAALDGQPTDKDALKAEIAKDPTVKADDKYKNATDENKQVYDDALAEAKRIDAKTDATQAEVNKAKQDLADAAAALDGQPTDKDALKAEIAKDPTVKDDDKYKNATENSKKAYDDALAEAKRIDAKTDATQAEVNKAKQDLANAAAALDGQPTNKDDLQSEVNKENSVKDSDSYKNGTEESKKKYDDALQKAKDVLADSNASQAEVDKAKKDLEDAAALDGQPTDKDALKAEIAKDPTVKADDKYKNATENSKKAYDDALAEAKRIDAKTDATQAEVNKAKEDLANAAAALDGQPTDKDALKAEIAKDPTTKADDKYKNATDEKKEAYDKALEEAKKVDEKEGATQAEVDKAKKDLEDAKNALDGQPTDKDPLKAEIAKDPSVKADSKYKNATDEKKEAYDKALEEAKKVDEKEGASQAEVDKAKKDLEDAKNALDGQPTNKDDLQSEVNKENDVKGDDKYKNATEDSKKAYDDALQKAKDVLADSNASQADVDKAKKDLEDAAGALDGQPTDKDALKAEIAKDPTVKDDDKYKNATDEKKEAYDKALEEAKKVDEKEGSTQAEVNKAKEDLANAAAALDGQPTDKDALKAEIAKETDVKSDDKYKNATDEKKEAYDKALEEAKKVDEKEGATQAEVDKAKKDLEDAKNALDGQPTDKDALKSEIAKDPTVKANDKYKNATDEKKEAYDKALEEAKKVDEKEGATQAEVDKAKKDLEDTKNALDGQPTDKDALKAEIAKEPTVKADDKYKNATDEKKEAYDKALEEAKKVDEKEGASQAEVDKAKKDLEDAKNALDGQPTNKDDLQSEVNKENDVKGSDNYKNATNESKKKYDDALQKAKDVLTDSNASQAEVDKAKKDLEDAKNALDGQPTDKDALKAEIAKDPTTKADDKYKNATDDKKEAYDKALEEAKKVDEKEGATQAEVDKAKKDLEDAKNALDGQPTNKDALKAEADKENDVKGSDEYKNASEDAKKKYDDALEKAKEVLNDPDASQAEVDKAKKDLEDAKGDLDGKETDKGSLKAEVDKEDTVKGSDEYKNASEDAKKKYDDALQKAKDVLNNPNASQADVDKAKEDLVNALEGLNGKPNVSQDSRNTNNRLPKTSVGSESLLTTFMSLVGGLYVFKKKRKK